MTKTLKLFTGILLLSSFSFSQKVTNTTIDGVSYYVYPFNGRLSYQNNYFDAFKRSSMKKYYTDLYEFNYADLDPELRKLYKKQARQERKENRRYNNQYESDSKHLKSKKFLTGIRKNPELFVYTNYSLESDIIPSLDPIPDGKYVQYFDTMWYLLPNGKFETRQLIAGKFEIKNNKLHGEATWFGPWGDTLKHGFYHEGSKVGQWELISKNTDRYLSKKDVKNFIATNTLKVDTVREIYHYENGISNGYYARYYNSKYPVEEGYYKDNEAVGEWIERHVPTNDDYTPKAQRIKWDNDIISDRSTTDDNAPLLHQPVIRFHQIPNLDDIYEYTDYNFEPKYYPYVEFENIYMYSNRKKEETLNLEEEEVMSYDGGERYYDEYEGDYYEEDYYDDETYEKEVYDSETDSYIPSWKLIDSIGIYFRYKGVYEKFYPNGQLMVRYEIDENGLKKEDTIFWDNGKAFDVITFDTDSNQFHQSIYDYDGKLFKDIVFDNKGKFLKVAFEQDYSTKIQKDGVTAIRENENAQFFRYAARDTLSKVLNDSLLLYASWFHRDTALVFQETYNPIDRQLQSSNFSALGNVVSKSDYLFGEDFQSWTGSDNFYLKNLRVETKSSGAMDHFRMTYYNSKALFDSIPQLAVRQSNQWFNVTSSQTLYKDEQPFSGEMNLSFTDDNFKLSTGKNEISLSIAKRFNTTKAQLDLLKYEMNGKSKNPLLLALLDESELSEGNTLGAYYELFNNFLNSFVTPPYAYYNDYDDYYEGPKRNKNRNKEFYPEVTTVTGQYVNGQASGRWVSKDQKGKLMSELPFVDGEINGTVKSYSYMKAKNPYYDHRKDTLPNKQVYYLSAVDNYKNGLMHGKSIEYNWIGEVTKDFTYVDGLKEGSAFERNKYAHSSMRFLNDRLDGYLNTYLTIPGKDSLLIYNLNFKNGLLQGESKAYHTNGRLAKRGFFLDGQPIDDYEAYDTLGFRYHYVKFLYSFPVEEKIWEENQLSVRYLFDWRDSIYFDAEDITTSQSLERILYQIGIGGEMIERPYYGRESIINKENIDYHMTKYYPNDTVARDGVISNGKKVGCWKYYNYYGELLYEVDYQDTVIKLNDTIQFASKGILTDYDKWGKKLSESYVIEKFEKYDCSHTDHYEIRQLKTIWHDDTVDRMNGYVKSYYDNGVLMNEGQMKDGNPTGVWKFYDPYGKLNQVGEYILGKRHGRWLAGDLSKTKFLGEICLNPNLPNLEEEIAYREKLLDILITNYKYGKALNKEYYDINLNLYEDEEGVEEIEMEEGE